MYVACICACLPLPGIKPCLFTLNAHNILSLLARSVHVQSLVLLWQQRNRALRSTLFVNTIKSRRMRWKGYGGNRKYSGFKISMKENTWQLHMKE
jgi:hypothetical protein